MRSFLIGAYFGFMSLKNMKICFLGAGNIAGAIINGLVSKGLLPGDFIYVYDLDKEKYKSDIMRRVNCCDTAEEAVSASDLVLLALKPSVISGAVKQLAESSDDFAEKTYISVAAGISSDFICKCFGGNVPVIRTMPNTPLLLGVGAVAVSHNAFVDDKVFRYVCRLFSGIAEIAVVDESMMNSIISVNGSSPAYVYLFYKAMLEGAVAQGIPADKACPLIIQSIKGAVAMIERSGKDIDTLIKDVSSPGGTTLAALSVFDKTGFTGIVADAMNACTDRAEEMAKEAESKL